MAPSHTGAGTSATTYSNIVAMGSLAELEISCPYCGEAIDVLLDQQDAGYQYIEDCQVCCKPIVFRVAISSVGEFSVSVHDENDAY